ncbi:fungal-specific transcription factor domain-containing protein [Trichoderma aethiopicum]
MLPTKGPVRSRSKRGCWTCRIRHRKCDEGLPFCKECDNRSIQCHGYGPRPSWLDNEELVRAELSMVKKAVKQNARLLNKGPIKAAGPDPHLRTISTKQQHQHNTAVTGPGKTLWGPSSTDEMRYREAELIMLYLDYIFYIQYPYYTDNAELGGRGWLFWLLLNNRPLRQASLTLAALYQRTKFARGTEFMEAELIEYHTTALSAMRHALSGHEGDLALDVGENLITFISSGCCLISFEVLQGGSMHWQTHLDALTTVVSKIKLPPFDDGSCESSTKKDSGGSGTLWRGLKYARRFEITKLLWFELLSTASTGVPPRMPYRAWLDSDEILMADFVGCQNWVMRAIGDLSMIQFGGDCPGIEQRRETLLGLEKMLREGIERLRAGSKKPEAPVSYYISRVFAAGALVLLHFIFSSTHPSEADIYGAVGSVMAELRQVPRDVSLRGVVWSICIAGSMAQPDQQPFFENLMTGILNKSNKSHSNFGNCESVQRILRQCWTKRHEDPFGDWTWRDAMGDVRDFPLLV